MKPLDFHNVSKRNQRKGIVINATLQAEVWRRQMKGKHKDTLAKAIMKKLGTKYPTLPPEEVRFITIKVI